MPRKGQGGRRHGGRPRPSGFTAPARLLTAQQAEAELGDAIIERVCFALQMPMDPLAWPVLSGLEEVVYVTHREAVVRLCADPHAVGQLLSTKTVPAIGVALVPKRLRRAMFACLGAEDLADDRDVLILDATDPGPNPLLEAALRHADLYGARP